MWTALFSITLGLSAFLLFAIQPFAGKVLMPVFGGAPAVWSACLVFFQCSVLVGYAYALVVTKYLSPRKLLICHLLLCACACIQLPISLLLLRDSERSVAPLFAVLENLVSGFGVLVIACSATSPLLQAVYGRKSQNPYPLYIASNAGSFIALLSYPFLIEPLLDLRTQAASWSVSFIALIPAALSALTLNTEGAHPAKGDSQGIALRIWLEWLWISFVPSALMIAVTLHLSVNIASVPLLWIFPLALYLLSYIVAFIERAPSASKLRRTACLLLVALTPTFAYEIKGMLALSLAIHLLLFFVLALYCQRLLYEKRPRASALTSFYFATACGGALGGIFATFVAPFLFATVIEYPLLAASVLFCGVSLRERSWSPLLFAPALFFAVAAIVAAKYQLAPFFLLLYAVSAVICYLMVTTPLRFACAYALLLATFLVCGRDSRQRVITQERNFFGPKKVVILEHEQLKALFHGTTVHGCESLDPERPLPQCYYHPLGPAGDLFRVPRKPGNIAIIGLGIGSMTCLANRADNISYFEIDPMVEKLARTHFTVLQQCGSRANVVIGDGRLLVDKLADHSQAMVIIDAFSSDAIPTHLLTVEAVRGYLRKLMPDGILVFHISNNHLELAPLLGALAKETGQRALERIDNPLEESRPQDQRYASHYALMTQNEAVIRSLIHELHWNEIREHYSGRVWTDDYSEVTKVLKGPWKKLSLLTNFSRFFSSLCSPCLCGFSKTNHRDTESTEMELRKGKVTIVTER